MENLRMARQGTSYTQPNVFSLAWGLGDNALREVIHVSPEHRIGRLNERIASGYIEETDEPVTPTFIPPPPPPAEFQIRLSAPAGDGDGLVFNADTGLFDPHPQAANIGAIELPENATPGDLAAAFNDLRVVLIEAALMAPDPS